jgi:2-iminoacetate synthase ThiH
MRDFQLDVLALTELLHRARQRATTAEVDGLLERARAGGGLDPEDVAVLWCSALNTETLYESARDARRKRLARLETFSPLYLTTTCDATCRMCGMRRDNDALERDTADLGRIEEQLRILQHRGMRAVALLTGEYRAARRAWAMQYVNQALHAALERQFTHVLLNVGGIDAPEFDRLLDGIERHADGRVKPHLTLSNFQETYCREHYAKFMGTEPDNPRADFERRLAGFDRAYRAGLRSANPGILLGLNRDLSWELTGFAMHARHLRALGMDVYLSVPRLRQIAGKHDQRGASDEEFVRIVSVLSMGLPDCKIVVTTREPESMQRKLVPIVTVLSAGSSAVAPYSETSAHYRIETSQFRVVDQRPFEEILREHVPAGGVIENFRPPVA